MHEEVGGDSLDCNKKWCKNKRVDALRGGWRWIGLQQKCKNKRVDTLRGGWRQIGLQEKV